MATDWITVEPNLDPILDPINPIIASIDSVLSLLITILNIVQTILNVIKVFLVGLLDPLRAIVELIIEEIRNLINDLRQLGVYITGDWAVLKAEDKWSNVTGGYQAYERRMLARLLDTSDPNRPAFSSSSAVIGAFFYVSSEDVNELIRVVGAILKFFGRPDLMGRARPYGTPTLPTMKYGTAGAGVGAFRQLSQASEDAIPDSVSVTWTMPAGTGGTVTSLTPAPKGFLIHISTIQDGFTVLSLTTKASTSAEVQNLPRVAAAGVDPITNGPLKLYGGLADIAVSSDATDFSLVEKSDNAQAPLLVLQKDQNTPLIRPSLLDQGGDIPLICNTYFVKTGFVSRLGPGTKFTATFQKSALPLDASFISGNDGFAQLDGTPVTANVYYIRVRAVTADYANILPEAKLSSPISLYKGTAARIYQFSYDKLLEAENGVLLPENPGFNGVATIQASAITAASGPGIATFPSSVQLSYIQAVQAAVAVAILCRADLTEGDIVEQSTFNYKNNTYVLGMGLKGLEGAGRDLLARYGIQPVWFRGNRPQQFRLQMRWALARVASDLQTRAPPPESVATLVTSQAQALLDFVWSNINSSYPGITILESLGIGELSTIEQSDFESEGVGGNPFCRMKHNKSILIQLYRDGGGPERSPAFYSKATSDSWVAGEGSADWSPIIFQDDSLTNTPRVEYIRNVLSSYQDGAVLDSATAVLQLAAASISRPIGDTNWIAIRLMPQALVPVDELLAKLDRFLAGILDGLQGIVDKIIAYIEAIQARIYQLQALLNQIQALLHALDFFQLPSMSGLILVESGTDGLVQGLISAGNKPSDSSSSYGAGVAVVSGGIPTVLLETLALILGGT